jgi:hypothetical protein
MNDWEADTPVWVAKGQLLTDLSVLGLSPALNQALLAWQAHFMSEFGMDGQWSSPQARQRHADEAERLVIRLRASLPRVSVTCDLWCLEGRAPRW